MKFKHTNGKEIKNIAEYIKDYLSQNGYEYEIYIGTDSRVAGNGGITFATVIAIRKVGKGVHLIYRNEKKKKSHYLGERLWWEVEYSIIVANFLRDEGVLDNINLFAIHLDLNKNKKYKSNTVLESARGYVTSQGFLCDVKPDAWAASYCADMLCR